MEGELKKLTIESYTDPEYQGSPVSTFEVMFNPKSYAVKYAVEYDDEQGMGTTGLPQRFKQSKPSEFALEFILDGTGASSKKAEVSKLVEDFLAVAYEYDGELHRPRYLKVAWGTLLFNSVFKAANITYTLFKPDGSPLRAKVGATFFGFVEEKRRVAEERAQSPDLTQVHTVTSGETLPLLSFRYYGDQMHYLDVAEANGLTDFRSLNAGSRLVFPPLAKA
ncbi:MAG: hypothetical protein O7G83_21305 [Proteobacteria bacterium]|nr:hypothetical protein [Pseudomonadota bacterium]